MEHQQDPPQRRLMALPCYFFLTGVFGLYCGKILRDIPSDAKTAVLLGFSAGRLLLFGLIAFMLIISFAVALLLSLKGAWRISVADWVIDHEKRLSCWLFFSGLVALLFWLAPDYRFLKYAAFSQRIKPLVLQLCFTGIAGFFMVRFLKNGSQEIRRTLHSLKPEGLFWLFLSGFFVVALFIRFSGWGVSPGSEAWYENAVPLLPAQIVLLLLAAFLLARLMRGRLPALLQNRTALFFIIWGIGALCWNSVPSSRHFFAPGPYPPNNEWYPYSDALLNDLAAQTALNGLKFNFGRVVLKPIVSFVLYVCHLLAGGNFSAALMLQSGLFALLPAILFLFASDLGGITCGLFAAGLMILQEMNALNTHHILTIHSRLAMSEFTAQVLFALFALFIFRWLRQGRRAACYAAAAGGVLSLLIYTRFNFTSLLFAVVPISLITLRHAKKRWLTQSMIFFCAFLVGVSPWVYRSWKITDKIAPEILDTFQAVIIDQRLKTIEPEVPVSAGQDPVPQPEKTAPDPAFEPVPATPLPSVAVFSELESRSVSLKIHPVFDQIANHTLHNLSAMLFMLPLQLRFDDLDHLYSASDSVWKNKWDGRLAVEQMVFLLLIFILFSAGCTALWQRFGWNGLSFLYFVIVYCASLGLARTSGGRYLVPMNWSVPLLLAVSVGAVALRFSGRTCSWSSIGGKLSSERMSHLLTGRSFLRIALICVGFMSVYLSMIVIETFSSAPASAGMDASPSANIEPILERSDQRTEIADAVQNGDLMILHGIALYPRFYYFNQGESGSDLLFKAKPFSRMVFQLILADRFIDVLLPLQTIPDIFENRLAVTVLACPGTGNGYFDALAVYGTAKDGQEIFLLRDPASGFACPLTDPVCPNIGQCY